MAGGLPAAARRPLEVPGELPRWSGSNARRPSPAAATQPDAGKRQARQRDRQRPARRGGASGAPRPSRRQRGLTRVRHHLHVRGRSGSRSARRRLRCAQIVARRGRRRSTAVAALRGHALLAFGAGRRIPVAGARDHRLTHATAGAAPAHTERGLSASRPFLRALSFRGAGPRSNAVGVGIRSGGVFRSPGAGLGRRWLAIGAIAIDLGHMPSGTARGWRWLAIGAGVAGPGLVPGRTAARWRSDHVSRGDGDRQRQPRQHDEQGYRGTSHRGRRYHSRATELPGHGGDSDRCRPAPRPTDNPRDAPRCRLNRARPPERLGR